MTNSIQPARSGQVNSSTQFLNIPVEIAHLPLTVSAKLVYGALKMHCRHKNICRVRWAVLQAETGCSRATVARSLRALRGAQLVGNLRTGRSSYYYLIPPDPPEDVDNSALDTDPACTKSQNAHFHKRDSVKTVCTKKAVPNLVLCTQVETSVPVGNNLTPIPPPDETPHSDAVESSQMAVLLAFLTRGIRDAGIGWKLHNDNLERVQDYFRQYGFDRTWKLADHCFHEGEDGGAALWDWSLAQAGFPRASPVC